MSRDTAAPGLTVPSVAPPPAEKPARGGTGASDGMLRRLDRTFGGLMPRPASIAGFPRTAGFAFDDWGPGPVVESRPADSFTLLTLGLLCAVSAAGLAMTLPVHPTFSNISSLFPLSVPGFDKDLGVTVLSRAQRDFIDPPLHAGSFTVRPDASQGIGYDDNVLGYRGSPGSAIARTTASLAVNSDWSRNQLGAYFDVDHSTYLDTPRQSRTDWTAAIGGGLAVDRGDATLAYSHLSLHDDPTVIGAIPSSTPVPYTIEDVRADYTVPFGRLTLTPNVDYSLWRFGNTVIAGQSSDQSYRNRDVLQGGVAAKYQTGEQWNLLLTAAGIHAHYLQPQPGVPAPDSTSFVLMGGFDYQINGPLRLRALLGVEGREFTARAYRSRVTPVGQADLVWTPTGETTVTGTLARSIEDPAQVDTGGITLSRAEIEVDHELLRNVVLRGRLGAQIAEYLQGTSSQQVNVYGSLGFTWLINRSLQLIADYQHINQSGTGAPPMAGQPTQTNTGAYSRNIASVRLRVAL